MYKIIISNDYNALQDGTYQSAMPDRFTTFGISQNVISVCVTARKTNV